MSRPSDLLKRRYTSLENVLAVIQSTIFNRINKLLALKINYQTIANFKLLLFSNTISIRRISGALTFCTLAFIPN